VAAAGSASRLSAGTNGLALTLTFSNNLSLQDNSRLYFDLADVTQPGTGTNDLLVSQVLRTNEMQVWFLSEHLVDAPLTRV